MGMGLVPVQKSVMWGYLNHPAEKAVVALLAATERASPTDALFLVRAELEAAVGITTFGIQPVLFEHPDDDKIV